MPEAQINPENSILMRMFGCPQGFLGRLGGRVMARANRNCASWVAGLLDVQLLEVGFGPGIAIKLLTRLATGGYIFGVDPSEEMVAQATRRNRKAVETRQVELRRCSAASLPFADNTFDK